MFGNINKPTFGATAPNTSFGFGTSTAANANPFGQSQLFGKPATGGFGSPSTSTFNLQPTNTLFPSTQAQPTNLFQNANTTFGTPPSTQSGFGTTNLFGQQQQPSGLFNTSSTFGQQNKPTGFGFGTQATQPSLFGQQPQQQQASTIFQPTTNSLFGGSNAFGGQQTMGTVIKFNPVTGTDTMMKNGVAQSINTKHHSITCMKEYENKSFEELRFEDYSANRKGPQQQTGFGATPFGTAPVSSTPSLFGQTDASKPAFGQTTGFGQTTSTFGQSPGFGLGTSQPQGLFGKSPSFGTPTSNTGTFTGFGATPQNANPFGANQAAKPFGTTTQTIFGTGTNTTTTGFGTGLFSQQNTQQNVGLFNKPAQPTTAFGQNSTTGFSFPTPAATQANNLFQNKPLFGQTSTNTPFGQTNTFGQNTFPFSSKPTLTAFPTTQTPGFGTNLGVGQNQNANPFGSNAAKPLFGNTGTSLFGNTNNTFQSNTGFGLQQPHTQQSLFPTNELHSSPNFALLTSDPFGDAPHLAGLEPKLKQNSPSISTTDPKELKSLLDASKKVDTTSNNKLKVVPIKSVRDSLFEGISAKQNDTSNSMEEYVKTNHRRLVLKHRPGSGGDGHSPSMKRMDLLNHLNLTSDSKNNSEERNTSEPSSGNSIRTAPLRLNFENTISDEHQQTNHLVSPSKQTYIMNNSLIKNNSSALEKSSLTAEEIDEEQEPSEMTSDTTEPVKKHPSGIICNRPEYYTLPNLDDLTQYVDENGSCIVKGFTIGRKGYGNVYFPEEIDVAGLNIDELVHFRYREINVYPDDNKKPPIGQGLNRKAQVTLDKVYPRRLGTNTLIKDVNELLQMNFAERLRKVTMKKDAKFVDYRPETGSWVFKVDHFSRYGFDDSDEDSEQNGQAITKKKAEAEVNQKTEAGQQGHKTVEELAKVETLKKGDKNKEIESSKLALDDEMYIEQGEQFQGEEDLLRQSMFVDDVCEDDYNTISTDIPLHLHYDSFRTSKNVQVMKSTLFADDDRSSDGGGSHISIIRQYLDIPEEMPRLPVLHEEYVAKKSILRPNVVKVNNFGGCEKPTGVLESRCYQDLAIYKSKSFKVGWNKGFNFYSLNTKQGEINGQLAVNTIDCGFDNGFDVLTEFLEKSLEIVLKESTYTLDDQHIPTFKILKSDSYLKKQTKLFSKIMLKYNDKSSQYMYSIWTLAEALWGPNEETISNRRHLLSEWLKTNTDYDNFYTKETAKDIFSLLSVFKTAEASSLAMEKQHPNISLLISQLSVTNRSKMFLQEQIEIWYKSMVSNHISEDVKKIYLLLSGIPLKDEVNIFQNVDWKRAFGMHMWYVSPTGAPLEVAIELFKKAFQEQGYAEYPNPPYRSNYVEDGAFDILYHILILYKTRIHRLSSVLNPATHTSNQLDYRLSWLLLQLFLSLDVGIIDVAEKNKLCTSFSNQLESVGKWEWAIFALLYLENDLLKKNLIMSILDRNLSPDVDKVSLESENVLINQMHLPVEWIHQIKGEKTMHQERFFEAFNHLAFAGDYCKANDILIEKLLPNLFINEQYDIIKFLINSIKDGADEILSWYYEAGLFLDFLNLQERVISYKSEDLMKLQAKLQSICERISKFPIKTDQQKLCVAEISKRCASVYKELSKKLQSHLFMDSYSDFLDMLVMPPDFKQNEAFYLINDYD